MRRALALVAVGLAFASGPIGAQTADTTGRVPGAGVINAPNPSTVPGSERRYGPGVISAPDETSVPGSERRYGPGVLHGPDNERGARLSAEQQRARSRSHQTYAECALQRDRQRSEMTARAVARGTPAPGVPERDVCAGLPR